MEAAELLGVNHKTLTRAEESGEITGRMGDALELLLRRADDAEVARLREAVGALEERVAALEGGMETPPAADVEGGGESSQVEGGDEDGTQAQAQGGTHEEGAEGADRSETRAAPRVAGLRSKKRATLRRLDPEVVTEEPADDDDEVYGDAWPLVEEWRRLRSGHPHQGKSLSWLTTEERLLVLELAMLEEHGLTLPPETQALRGFGTQGPDQPSLEGAGRHSGGAEEAEAAALGADGPHPVAVAEVGPGDGSGAGFRRLLHRSEVGAKSERAIWA